MARFIDAQGVVWFNDGIIQDRRSTREGHLDNVDIKLDPNGKTPDTFIYKCYTGNRMINVT